MKEEIRKALDNASTEHEWETDGTFIEWKDGHPLKGTHRRIAITNARVAESFKNENHENDANLIVNTPKYLEWCLSQLIEKDKQIAELREVLSFYANQENYEIEQGEYYSKMWVDEGFKARQALQGGDKNDR